MAIFLPPRKPELPGDDKTKTGAGSSPFANPLLKPAAPAVQSTSSLSTSRTGADDSKDIYKTHPAFVAIIEPMANRFMTIKELIEVLTGKKEDRLNSFVRSFFLEITISRIKCFS